MDTAGIAALIIAVAAFLTSLYALYIIMGIKRRFSSLLSAMSVNSKIIESIRETAKKPRKRYIVFEVQSGKNHSEKEVAKAIIEEAREVLGQTGLVDSGIHLVIYDAERRIGVLRVKNTYKYQALAILGMVRSIGDERVRLIPLYTSGTLKKALKRAGVRKK